MKDAGWYGSPLYFGPFLAQKPARVAAAVTALARAPEGTVIFRCAGGKDRTGLISLILLALAGVPPAVIAAGFELTIPALPPLLARLGIEWPGPDMRDRPRDHGTAIAAAIAGLLDTLDPAACLATAGVAADIAALRARLT